MADTPVRAVFQGAHGERYVCAYSKRTPQARYRSTTPEHELDCWVWNERIPSYEIHVTANSPREGVELALLRERNPRNHTPLPELVEV